MAEDYGDLAEQYGPPDPGPSWNDTPKRKQPLDPTEGLEPQNFVFPSEAWDTESGPSEYRQQHPYQLYETKQPAPQQAPPKLAPAIPLPFTQSDAIRLQKLQNGLAEAQRQVEAGEIDPQLGEHYKGQILPQYQELLQKQGQYKQQQQQEAMQQQMQQAAQQQALRQANASHWAQGFSDTVAQFTDPATGRHAFMAQEADGSWKELKFEDHNARQQLIQNEMVPPSVMAAPGATPGATPGAEDSGSGTIGASAQAGEPSPLGSQPPQQAQQPQTLEDFVKETYQGPRVLNTAGEDITDRQRQAYDRTKATPRDELGRPTGPPPDEPGVKAHPYAEFLRRAERAIAKPNTQGLDPRQAANVMERWRDHVVGLAGHMLTQHDREEQHKQDYQTRTEENQRHEAAQKQAAIDKKAADVAENKRKEEVRKEAATTQRNKDVQENQAAYLKQVQHHEGSLDKTYKEQHDAAMAIQRDKPEESKRMLDAIDPRLKSREERIKYARALADNDWNHLGQKFGQGGPNPTSPVPQPNAADLALLQERQRRDQEGQGKAAKPATSQPSPQPSTQDMAAESASQRERQAAEDRERQAFMELELSVKQGRASQESIDRYNDPKVRERARELFKKR